MISSMTNDLKGIYIHPIFKPLSDNFKFSLVEMNMMVMPVFQDALIKAHKGEKSVIEISVKYNEFKNIQYDVGEVIDSFNKEVNLERNGSDIKCDIKHLLNFQARLMAIVLFDILQISKYNKFLNRTEIFKFSKHIRNGAAHNNRFTFTSPLKKPIKWHNKIIDNTLNKKEVFPSFITGADLILLISDISSKIKNFD